MTTFPTAGDDTKVRHAMVRTLTHQMNQTERHHRTMTGQEELAARSKEYAERSDQGHHSICSMLDEVSDQISEGHEAMATKADIAALNEKMDRVVEHLIRFDHVVIPRDQSNDPRLNSCCAGPDQLARACSVLAGLAAELVKMAGSTG